MVEKVLVGQTDFCDAATIQAGLDLLAKCPRNVNKELLILSGKYEEYIECRLSHFTMTGVGNVVITGKRYAQEKMPDGSLRETFRSATVFIEGIDIRVENITILNEAGEGNDIGQGIALFNSAHQIVLVHCNLKGKQDTLCTGPLPSLNKEGQPLKLPQQEYGLAYCKQEYINCYIEGTVDFIFGGADATFINCQLHSKQSVKSANGYITAASTPKGQASGYYFKSCVLTADEKVTNVYLGRPWRAYAKTTFCSCWLGEHIHLAGWHNWGNPDNEQTVRYCEHDCYYSTVPQRLTWTNRTSRKGG